LSLADLCQIPVPAIVAPAATLFLWVPSRLKFSHGYRLALAWDFPDYQATVYWAKTRLGMGFWFRGQVEELLVFTRGPVRAFRCQRPNLITCPTGEHSQKPEEFRTLIEQATGLASSRRNVELFGRRKVPGWTVLGDQVTGRDIRVDIRELASTGTRMDAAG
jgi:N6-adenosine-specific RNA methylase IME4